MRTRAIIIREPHTLDLAEVELAAARDGDVEVDVLWTGVSAGTERLFWSGRMPPFPGMGYPLVPGYEVVGRVRHRHGQAPDDGDATHANAAEDFDIGDLVFVPGANCYQDVRGLFGGAAARLRAPADKLRRLPRTITGGPDSPGVGADSHIAGPIEGTLLALAATAQHALASCSSDHGPSLIVGHGALGRLVARLMAAQGFADVTVWETASDRRDGAAGYSVIDPSAETQKAYARIIDVSGDAGLLDTLIGHLAPGGEIVLAGFYADRLSFSFPPAFMREARFRVAAQWQASDLDRVIALADSGALSLAGLITHTAPVSDARAAYDAAFNDPACLKMVLHWEGEA